MSEIMVVIGSICLGVIVGAFLGGLFTRHVLNRRILYLESKTSTLTHKVEMLEYTLEPWKCCQCGRRYYGQLGQKPAAERGKRGRIGWPPFTQSQEYLCRSCHDNEGWEVEE